MIKMYDEIVPDPLKITFDTAFKYGSYPERWKIANVVPVHKEERKNI